MSLDPEALRAERQSLDQSWTSADCLLYAVAVGAETDELSFVTENSVGVDQQVFPTFAVILHLQPVLEIIARVPGLEVAQLLHAGHGVEVTGPLPVAGYVRTDCRVADIYDKGRAAIVVFESESSDRATGELLVRTRHTAYLRDGGGFGGDAGPPQPAGNVPDREPDTRVSYPTSANQALLYRLCGDRNPLHSDPEAAKRAGFDRPILHGLCTFAIAQRAVLRGFCGGQSVRFRSLEGRFASPAYPGDGLTVELWKAGPTACLFRTVTDDGRVVLDRGRATFLAHCSPAGEGS